MLVGEQLAGQGLPWQAQQVWPGLGRPQLAWSIIMRERPEQASLQAWPEQQL